MSGISDGLAQPISVAASGELLWVLTNGSLYRVSLAEASYGESTLVYSDLCPNSRIAYRDGLLYVLSYEDQALSLYCLEQDMQACTPCGTPLNCEGFFVSQDEQRYVDLAAFAPLTDTSWAALLWTSAERGLLLYGDSRRGEIREVAVPSVVSIAPAGEASIYASLSTGELRRVDLSTGQQTVLAQLALPACCLAATEDGSCLYFADRQQVYRYTESTGMEAYDRSPISGQGAWYPACVAGDRYVLGDYSGLFMVEQPDTSLPLLTIASYENKQVVQDFEGSHDVRVLARSMGMYFDAEELMQDMVTQNDAYDIYLIEVSTGCLSVLMQKGYYVPLDASNTLVAALDAMDPNLTALLKQDGHYAAFPEIATAHMLCINTKAMEEFGLTEEDLPRTFSEFLPWLAEQYEKSQDLGRTCLGYAALATPQRLYPAAAYVYQAMRAGPRGAGLYQLRFPELVGTDRPILCGQHPAGCSTDGEWRAGASLAEPAGYGGCGCSWAMDGFRCPWCCQKGLIPCMTFSSRCI